MPVFLVSSRQYLTRVFPDVKKFEYLRYVSGPRNAGEKPFVFEGLSVDPCST